MALKLTPTSLTPDTSSNASGIAGFETDAAAVQRLVGRAIASLTGNRLLEYRELFDEVESITDPNRRYQARKQMLEQGLSNAASASASVAADVLIVTAAAALVSLDAGPAEPVLLNYAGVAFYELWSLDAAYALFSAAYRLDPALPHLRRNLTECKRRRGVGGRPKRLIHGVPPEFVSRAKRVAALAKPASGRRLSLCMIVRDEEEMLPRCLEAAAPAVDEIVIVDTGSRDRTVEIARSFGATVIERDWTGSFSDARNVSFDNATGDWIMYLDADEVLVDGDAQRLRQLTTETWREAFYLVETNFTGFEDAGTALTHSALRVFRNRPQYRFEGRLHEQIAQHLPAYVPERLQQTSIRVEHYGYLSTVRDAKEKSQRNIELLRAQKAEGPPSPFLHFNLGSEYLAVGDARAALAEYEQAWELIRAEGPGEQHEFTPSLVSRMVKALRACDRPQDAISLAEDGLTRFPGFTDLVFEQASALLSVGRRGDAIAHYERCIEMGDAPARYAAVVGCGTYLPRIALAELHLAKRDAEAALELLRACADTNPEFFGLILPYATALLRSGATASETVAEIEHRIPRMTPTVRFLIGTALSEAGAGEAAEQQFRLVLASQPHSGRARAALSEALLYQRRYAEAADEAAALADDDPLAIVACRSELFGRIAAGAFDDAELSLDRAHRLGIPAADRGLFESWLASARGETELPKVQIAALPLLQLMLESLLRVQDFENFERLEPVLRASELPVREQRELLATIFLRRGYLRSAGREWMAVVSDSPDARALTGLAQVAYANGQTDTAQTFAQNALTLDPAYRPAQALLETLRARLVPIAA